MRNSLGTAACMVFLMSFVLKAYAETALTIDDRAKLGEVYSMERLKEYAQAMPAIEALYQHYKNNREVKWTYARVLGFGGHWKEATAAFDQLCQSKCDNEMFVTYAHILEAQGPDPETLAYIKKLAVEHPDQKKIQSIYAEILSWDAQSRKGYQAIEELHAQYPQDLKITKAHADVLIGEKKYADAIAQMDKLLSQNPNDKNLRYQHAQVLSAAGKHSQAVKELQALLKDGFTNKEAIIKLGDELRFLGRDQEALKVYGEVTNEK